MTKKEFARLLAYDRAKRYSPWKPSPNLVSGKCSVKNKSAGVGQILKTSRIVSEIRLLECS